MPQPWTIRREVDLERDFVGVERIAALSTTSAKAAHELRIAVTSGGKPVDMDGASVLLNLILPDGISTTADGSIEAGACIAMLPPLCYQRGETRGVLLLQFGTQAAIPVYAFVLRCFEDLTDAFADPDHVIPSLAELLAQLDAAKDAAKAAEDGASAANAAAGAADAAAGNATAAAQSANNAASAATTAAQTANAAAARLDGMTATAEGLPAGSAPTVSVTTGDDGAKRLDFGIPNGEKGDTGVTPQLTVTAKTGEPGTQVQLVQGGTAEEPTITLTIPRGDTGSIEGLTINGKVPDASGNVTLAMEDIDGLAEAIEGAGGVKTVAGVSPDSAGNVPLTAESVGARPATWTPSASDVGAYPAESIRVLTISLAASAWTGSGPYTATINQAGVTANTDCRFELGGTQTSLTADIAWETAAGTITLTTAAKPTGTISGTVILTEVSA